MRKSYTVKLDDHKSITNQGKQLSDQKPLINTFSLVFSFSSYSKTFCRASLNVDRDFFCQLKKSQKNFSISCKSKKDLHVKLGKSLVLPYQTP